MSCALFLSGTVSLTLDDKGRMALPVRYRTLLKEECEGACVLTVSLYDPALWLYPATAFRQVQEELVKLPSFGNRQVRALTRLLLGNACEFRLDAQGRVLIPKNLRDFAGLNKNLTLVGMENKFEIWDEERYLREQDEDLSLLNDLSALSAEPAFSHLQL